MAKQFFFSVITLLSISLAVTAQTYENLWQKVKSAQEKDEPITALSFVRKIESMAQKEHHYGNLFAAYFTEMTCQQEISTDSFEVLQQDLIHKDSLLRSSDGVASAILRTVLYKFAYRLFSEEQLPWALSLRPDVDSLLRSKDAAIYTQANTVEAFLPIAVKRSGSKYFNNDLLSLIGYETGQFNALYRYYSSQSNREAAAILEQRLYDQSSHEAKDEIAWIDSMLNVWGKWEGISELHSRRAALVNPQVSARLSRFLINTSEKIMVHFSDVRNLSEAKLSITRLNITGEQAKSSYIDYHEYAKLKKHLQKSTRRNYTKKFQKHAEYEFFEDSLQLEALPLGVYLVELSTDNKQTPVERTILRVSDLTTMSISLPDKKTRLLVVNSITGHPVKGATVHVSTNANKNEHTYTTDLNGECIISTTNWSTKYYATTPTDNAQSNQSVANTYNSHTPKGENRFDDIFTDRQIYRPGQTVRVAIISSRVKDGKESMVASNTKVKLRLIDASLNEVENRELTTDEYGTTHAEFTIPEYGKNGMYRLSSDNNTVYIRVEEYVRPTFDVTIERPDTEYKNGDTLNIKGLAKSFSGVPVANAKVAYNIVRRSPIWWRPYSASKWMGESTELLSDTVKTNSDGSFTLRMPMVMEESKESRYAYFYSIAAEATVTDLAGESHSAYLSLPLSNRQGFLSCDLPEKILADKGVSVTIHRKNAANVEVYGMISLLVDGVHHIDVKANEAFPLNLESGKHKLSAICEGDTLTKDVVVFRLSDKRPVVEASDWWYETEDRTVQFGTSKHNVRAFYNVIADNKVLESGILALDSTLLTRSFADNEAYAKGVIFAVAWVRDGEVYTHQAVFKPTLPEKRLTLKWETFRNTLQPAQKEQWKLRICHTDGKPAKAQLLATLYDKSLDDIAKHSWTLPDHRWNMTLSTSWKTASFYNLRLFTSVFMSAENYDPLTFSEFNDEFLPYNSHRKMRFLGGVMAKNQMFTMSEQAVVDAVAMDSEEFNSTMEAPRLMASKSMMKAANGSTMEAMPVIDEVADNEGDKSNYVRENMAETAFFMPSVETDGDGIASLNFTLPESVTTWKLMGIAHDGSMYSGSIEAEAVAQKSLMVQPRVPRFLREGDKGSITTSVSNITDKDVEAKVTMTIRDDETETVLLISQSSVVVEANSTKTVAFDVDTKQILKIAKSKNLRLADGLGATTVTFTAATADFSDGELHLMPILSSKVTVVNTKPLVITQEGTTKVSVSDMLPKSVTNGTLTVEYTDSPGWLMLTTLPYMKSKTDDNAIALASAYYANSLASHIVAGNPELASMYDERDLRYRAEDVIERLSMLQNADGSWSWWRNMHGSRYITVEVVRTLLRLDHMVGRQELSQNLLKRAYNYLDQEIAKDIRDMKKYTRKGETPSLYDWHLDYLYCQSLAGRNENLDFLLPLLKHSTSKSDMQTKANASVVFALNGKMTEAEEFVESIMQHTVYKEDVGRYFDSYRANYSWSDYRIPTHVSAIEAIAILSEKTDASSLKRKEQLRDMRRWLMSSKRTQSWDTPINAVNAVYAFFCGDASSLTSGTSATFTLDGKKLEINSSTHTSKDNDYDNHKPVYDEKTVDNAGILSSSVEITNRSKALNINKKTKNESWAAVKVEFQQEQAEIMKSENGFKVKRETYGADGKLLKSGAEMRVGDRVKTVITITADRDYDFVTLRDNRAACLEPLNQLSGYHDGAYVIQRDNATDYHYNMVSKGKHRIETEYYVTRPGMYTAGIVTATCTYAPEFTGRCTTEAYEVK